MRIRDYQYSDAGVLALILHAAVHGVARRDYSQEQLAAWSPEPMTANRFHARVSDGRFVLVAVSNNDAPLAFIELEQDGHIDGFYCHPDAAGTGVGKALFTCLEDAAAAARILHLSVAASETARRFFLRAGFHVVARRDFDLRGAPIHNFIMEKSPCKAGHPPTPDCKRSHRWPRREDR